MWSINLLSESFKYVAPVAFTFHDGSINCKFATTYSTGYAEFTFHNVSINTDHSAGQPAVYVTLHSTMFLLIQRRNIDDI